MKLTVVWHDVVLIANPVNMVYSDHSVLYYTFRLSKNVFPLDEFVIPFPPCHISAKLYSPLYQICFFSVPPSKFTPPPHRKNDRSLMARGSSSGSCPMQQFWVAALVFCSLAAYFGLSTTYSHISPMWQGTTPITSNTLQGSCRKQKAIYYAKPMQNYEITIARKIFFKLTDTSEHSLTDWQV